MRSSLYLALILSAVGLVAASVEAQQPFTLSIAVPLHGKEHVLTYYGKTPHFHVIVSNISDKPQRVWQEWCSWGYYGLSFEVTDSTGKSWTAKKKPAEWSKNFPDFWTIPAHENLVLDVQFADTAIWDGFPSPKGDSETFKIRAVFEFQPDDYSRPNSIWTGRVMSKSEAYVIYK